MDPPPHVDDYIKHSIEHNLGLPVPDSALRLKLLASEDSAHRLRDKVFILEDRLRDREKRLEQWKAEAAMNAQGMRRCVEEKEAMAVRCAELGSRCARLERECSLYDRDVERLVDTCDEMARENEELRERLKSASDVMALAAEIESLKKDKEMLRINLLIVEEEVRVLSEENDHLDRDNRSLLSKLKKERNLHAFNEKQSTSPPTNGKHKASLRKRGTTESTIDLDRSVHSPRVPLLPLKENSTMECPEHRK